jgi:hypothetical protein
MDGTRIVTNYIPIKENFRIKRFMELKLELLIGRPMSRSKNQYSFVLKMEESAKLLTTITTLMFMSFCQKIKLSPLRLKKLKKFSMEIKVLVVDEDYEI